MALAHEQLADARLSIPAEAERFYVNVSYQLRGEFIAKNLKHIIFLSVLAIVFVAGIFTANSLLLMASIITSVVSFFIYLIKFNTLPSDAVDGMRFVFSSRRDNRANKVHDAYMADLRRADDAIRWIGEIVAEPMFHLRFTQNSEFFFASNEVKSKPITSFHTAFVPDMHAIAVALVSLIQEKAPEMNGSVPIALLQERASLWNPGRAMYMVNRSKSLDEVFSELNSKMSHQSSQNNPDIPLELANLVGLLASVYAQINELDSQLLGVALDQPVFEAIASRSHASPS